GVSAFGFRGTDFHVGLEEYADAFLPESAPVLDPWPVELFLWRGDSRAEVAEAVDALAGELAAGAEPALADLAYTLALRAGAAQAGTVTLAVVAESLSDLAQKLP